MGGGERGKWKGTCLHVGKLPPLLPDGENGKEEQPAKQDQGVEQHGRRGLVPCLQFKLRKSRSEVKGEEELSLPSSSFPMLFLDFPIPGP